MSDRVDTEALAAKLSRVHFDGEGCGTYGSNACSVCHGPSPMSALEVAQEVVRSDWLSARDARVRAGALAPVLALAEEWEATAERRRTQGGSPLLGYTTAAGAIRTALTASSVGSGVGEGSP